MRKQKTKLPSRYGKVKRQTVGKTRLICGGLIAIGGIIIQDFISVGVFKPANILDIPALISVIAFALALPLLSLHLLAILEDEWRKSTIEDTRGIEIAYWIGVASAFIGIVAAFWYISLIAGIVAAVSMIAAVILYLHYFRKLHDHDEYLKTEKKIDNVL